MGATTAFHFRDHWRQLKRGRPGRRFQDRYEHARKQEHQAGPTQRILLIVVALVFLLIAAVLTVIPGPAFVFFILAGALLATESRTIARFMDWSEVHLRKLFGWARRKWRRLPRAAQIAFLVLAALGAVGAAFLGYRVLRG